MVNIARSIHSQLVETDSIELSARVFAIIKKFSEKRDEMNAVTVLRDLSEQRDEMPQVEFPETNFEPNRMNAVTVPRDLRDVGVQTDEIDEIKNIQWQITKYGIPKYVEGHKFYKCNFPNCNSSGNFTRPGFTVHIRIHLNKKFACHICYKEFNSASLIGQHLEYHVNPFKYDGCIITPKKNEYIYGKFSRSMFSGKINIPTKKIFIFRLIRIFEIVCTVNSFYFNFQAVYTN